MECDVLSTVVIGRQLIGWFVFTHHDLDGSHERSARCQRLSPAFPDVDEAGPVHDEPL